MKIIFIILAIVYTTGYFLGTVDFDPGAENATISSTGDADVYIH